MLIDLNGAERLYFVVETKSSLFTDNLRDQESAKIRCGESHFGALARGGKPVKFIPGRNLDDVMSHAGKGS